MHKPAKLGANADAWIVGCSAPTMGEHDSQTRRSAVARILCAQCARVCVMRCVAMEGLGYLEEEGVRSPAGGLPVLTAVRRL